ncbi:MAG: GNAT family N-acetyltransferase, partial [Anaerolineae bacterium]|nr:GNAT family N-acetyltransferase [Anaerolineae bacterium]
MTLHDENVVDLHLQVRLRVAQREDIPKLEWYGQYLHFRNLFRRTYHEQQAGKRLMLLADLNNFPIGHIFIHFKTTEEPYAYLYSFRVMEMFQRQGVGTRLIHSAEAIVTQRGLNHVTIAVAKANKDALRLYKRLDYHIFSEDEGHWQYRDHRGDLRHVHEP